MLRGKNSLVNKQLKRILTFFFNDVIADAFWDITYFKMTRSYPAPGSCVAVRVPAIIVVPETL